MFKSDDRQIILFVKTHTIVFFVSQSILINDSKILITLLAIKGMFSRHGVVSLMRDPESISFNHSSHSSWHGHKLEKHKLLFLCNPLFILSFLLFQ